jgi:hypothetical protein
MSHATMYLVNPWFTAPDRAARRQVFDEALWVSEIGALTEASRLGRDTEQDQSI